MDSFLQDLRFGLRTLGKRPVFAAIAASTLGLGIGSATTMFSAVKTVLVESVPFEGTLKIDPLFGREVVYDFTFKAGKEMYRFLGRKKLDFQNPVRTMTHLAGQVEKDGMTFAEVVACFDVKELPQLVLSFRAGL